MRQFFTNIWQLGIKELWSLRRDPTMLVLIAYVFTAGVYSAKTAADCAKTHNAGDSQVKVSGFFDDNFAGRAVKENYTEFYCLFYQCYKHITYPPLRQLPLVFSF